MMVIVNDMISAIRNSNIEQDTKEEIIEYIKLTWLYSEHVGNDLEHVALDPKIMDIINNENYILTASEIRRILNEA